VQGRISVTVRPVSSLDDIIQGIEQLVRVRAFELYLNRGRQPGREVEDWQNASAELLKQPPNTVAEGEFQTAVEFYLTEEEIRDVELLAAPQAILLISKPRESGDSRPPSRIFKLVSLQHPIDIHSVYADFTKDKLFCSASAAQSAPILKATA
jgi:hypothetical protein